MKLLLGIVVWTLSSIGVVVGLSIVDFALEDILNRRFNRTHREA